MDSRAAWAARDQRRQRGAGRTLIPSFSGPWSWAVARTQLAAKAPMRWAPSSWILPATARADEAPRAAANSTGGDGGGQRDYVGPYERCPAAGGAAHLHRCRWTRGQGSECGSPSVAAAAAARAGGALVKAARGESGRVGHP